jgi:soluble cytochrome b562
MSISSIASSSVYQNSYTNPFKTVKKDFQDITSALQSGNMSAAQTAFSAFQTDASALNGTTSSNNNPVSQDIQGLGTALQSGSLSDAQQALSKIHSDIKGHGAFARQQMEMQSSLSSGSDTENTLKQDFQNLSAAIQSGNLTDAQKAFATLQQAAPSQSGQNTSQFSTDIQSLGTALQSGNVSDAQKAFATLQQDMAAASSTASGSTSVGHHHHHHHSGSSQSAMGANATDLLSVLATNSTNTAGSSNTAGASNSSTNLSSLLGSAISNYMKSSSNSNLQSGLLNSSLFTTPSFV